MTIKKSVAERIGEIIAEIQEAETPKKNHNIAFILLAIFMVGVSILIAQTVETKKTTKAFEQREFGKIINETWGLNIK